MRSVVVQLLGPGLLPKMVIYGDIELTGMGIS